ncbi:MAG: LysR family transcriptional regulator [Oscillospiraceae bacterium]|nr:LysR family transcriptional regulator [Oscillospiraceae bacterium]
MNIKELNSVVAVYQYKSFAEAAYQTSFSISAVSKHVQHVENELGIQLFRRKNYKNNKLLTSEGERLMPYILQLTDLSRCLEQMAEELRSQSEMLTVGGIELMSGGVFD